MKRLASTLLVLLLAVPALAQKNAVSGGHVLDLTRQYLAVAPRRAVGTPGHAAAEKFIREHFTPEAAKGDFVADSFTANTPAAGMVTMTNFIVKYPGKKDGVIVLATHYETNWPLRNINFVGANDGACTTALLIALGEYFRIHPPQGYSVWLLFDDGEEAVENDVHTWNSNSDALYGTRHLAAKWDRDGTLKKIKAFILADMIGWSKMVIDRDGNSTPWLVEDLVKAARETGHARYVATTASQGFEDDHLPFRQRGVPVLDVIAFEYGNAQDPEAFHHTTQDTIDKLSTSSLQVSADLFLQLIKLVDQR
jgi:Zn-dependent M28 family amino/carboxypeptidase